MKITSVHVSIIYDIAADVFGDSWGTAGECVSLCWVRTDLVTFKFLAKLVTVLSKFQVKKEFADMAPLASHSSSDSADTANDSDGRGSALLSDPGDDDVNDEAVNTKWMMMWSRAAFDWGFFKELWEAIHTHNNMIPPEIQVPSDLDLKRRHSNLEMPNPKNRRLS